MLRPNALLAVLVLPALLACDGGSGSGWDSGWCASYAEASCRWTFTCCDPAQHMPLDLSWALYDGDSEDACQEYRRATCGQSVSLAQVSADAGRMRFDASAADACLRAVQGLACGAQIGDYSRCLEEAFAGTVPLGGDCANDDECVDEGFCEAAPGTSPGRCRAKSAEGGTCELPTTPSLTTVSRGCLDPLYCAIGKVQTLVCVPRVRVRPGERCGVGLRCPDDFHCGQGYLCEAGVPEGAGCSTWQMCSYGTCEEVTECATGLGCRDGTCQPRVADGGECEVANDCQAGSYCEGRACTPRKGAKAACLGSDECLSTLSCGASGTCEPRAEEGDTCLASRDCQEHLKCESRGTCRTPAPKGDPCSDLVMCAGGLFCDPSGRTCVDLRPVGGFCASSSECLSGQCMDGLCIDGCAYQGGLTGVGRLQ